MSEDCGGHVSKVWHTRRDPEQPVVSIMPDGYALRMEHIQTGDTTRSELASELFENSREAAKSYVKMERCSRPDWWNDWTRDPESRYWMHKHLNERRAWASAIDLLWEFSDGEDVDADALREALIRQSYRRHRSGGRGDRDQEHIFVRASSIVREKSGLDDMTDPRRESLQEDYRE